MEQLTQKRLQELFTYNPETGLFTRNRNGKVATSMHNGYIRIGIDYKDHYAHRLAYLYMTGELPKNVIDHQNQIKTDNCWSNLRELSVQENSRNTSLYNSNSSDFTGVYWHCRDQCWIAFIHVDGSKKHLGCFKYKSDAVEARKKANGIYGFHENHGQCRRVA